MPALTYIPEVILKKRKSNEEWALKRKAQYEERQSIIKKRAKQDFIRMPEDFIKQYRTRVTLFTFTFIYLYVFLRVGLLEFFVLYICICVCFTFQ